MEVKGGDTTKVNKGQQNIPVFDSAQNQDNNNNEQKTNVSPPVIIAEEKNFKNNDFNAKVTNI